MAELDPRKERIAILDFALTALALASGVTDVATFLTLGDVFTSAMTGNTALLGIALSHGEILAASHSFSALIGFMCGAALGTIVLVLRAETARGLLAIRPLLAFEIFCLGAFAVILTLVDRPGEAVALYALILLSSIGMGVQGIVARHINSPGINTIVFTTTLVSIVSSLTAALLRRSEGHRLRYATKRQIGIFLAYGLGALVAGILAGPRLPVLAWVPLGAVLAALGCCEAAIRTGSSSR
jgi:uncharacterized membrane protein YoaK (UPF0700 family)